MALSETDFKKLKERLAALLNGNVAAKVMFPSYLPSSAKGKEIADLTPEELKSTLKKVQDSGLNLDELLDSESDKKLLADFISDKAAPAPEKPATPPAPALADKLTPEQEKAIDDGSRSPQQVKDEIARQNAALKQKAEAAQKEALEKADKEKKDKAEADTNKKKEDEKPKDDGKDSGMPDGLQKMLDKAGANPALTGGLLGLVTYMAKAVSTGKADLGDALVFGLLGMAIAFIGDKLMNNSPSHKSPRVEDGYEQRQYVDAGYGYGHPPCSLPPVHGHRLGGRDCGGILQN